MEAEIHRLEKEAYSAVLRAFKAQADALSWEKEDLITQLREELRLSDDEHRELLTSVIADDAIREIRERRLGDDCQRTRQSFQTVPDDLPALFSGRLAEKRSISNCTLSNALVRNKPANAADANLLMGREVWTRSPGDNNFDEPLINNYNPSMFSSDDIQRCKGYKMRFSLDSETSGKTGRGKPIARYMPRLQSQRKFLCLKNGTGEKGLDDIELLDTASLVKEVESLLTLNHPQPLELDKMKKILKEHEQALVNALARLPDVSD